MLSRLFKILSLELVALEVCFLTTMVLVAGFSVIAEPAIDDVTRPRVNSAVPIIFAYSFVFIALVN